MPETYKPIVLIILDGWGHSENPEFNAIHHAKKTYWNQLIKHYPNVLIKGSGAEVGLPSGQMGNSEVGHLNLGAGRVVYQEFTRVSRAIRTGSFLTNQTLTDGVDLAIENNKAVHILGLLSAGGVHSHEEHIQAMVELAVNRGAKKVYIHAFLDGRDTPPISAAQSLNTLQDALDKLGTAKIASIVGRYFAMDRDNRWTRVKSAFDAITHGKAEYHAKNCISALQQAYDRDETDEFVQATNIIPDGEKAVKIENGDVVFFMNYRSDRARQITRPFIEADFADFDLGDMPTLGSFISLTEYSAKFDIPVAFPPARLKNVLGEHLQNLGLHQLRIAETEKYAHVTFFFNGGEEEPFEGEDRILVKSPDVATYDLQPEMSSTELTDRLVDAIEGQKYDVIICNYANPDMVGHTGDFEATVKAIDALDGCLQRVVDSALRCQGELLITADHGNAEQMRDPNTGQPHTAHTNNPIPLLYIGRPANLSDNGTLSDIAPTILHLLAVDKPAEMGGTSLVSLLEDSEKPDLRAVESAETDRKIV